MSEKEGWLSFRIIPDNDPAWLEFQDNYARALEKRIEERRLAIAQLTRLDADDLVLR